MKQTAIVLQYECGKTMHMANLFWNIYKNCTKKIQVKKISGQCLKIINSKLSIRFKNVCLNRILRNGMKIQANTRLIVHRRNFDFAFDM